MAYAEKEEAGRAVLDFDKTLVSPEPTPLGSYRGFALEIGFDSASRKFEIVIVGASKRTAELGTDEAGAVTRIDNAIARAGRGEASPQRRRETDRKRKAEIAKPFDKEDDLESKSKRLAEPDKLLNMDKADAPQLCDEEKQAEKKEIAHER